MYPNGCEVKLDLSCLDFQGTCMYNNICNASLNLVRSAHQVQMVVPKQKIVEIDKYIYYMNVTNEFGH